MSAPLILIVEDDGSIRESLRELLVEEGYRVAEAATGQEALAELEREAPGLVLLDLWMPEMTGAELEEKMTADPRWSSVPVVIVTAANEPTPRGREVLRKPISLAALLDSVSRNLNK